MALRADDDLDGTWPFAPHFCHRRAFPMHFVDAGAGSPVVLLHGEPTWGYLCRRFITPLAGERRVVVPDHMGFGKSGTPADRTYLLDEHVDNLEALLVEELDLHDITLVLHDWGGLIGGGFALRHPDRVARMSLINTLVPLGLQHDVRHLVGNFERSAWFTWAREAFDNGTSEEVLGNAGHTVVHLMLELQGIVCTEVVDSTWIRAYSAPFGSKEGCRGVIRFPQQLVAPVRSMLHHHPPPTRRQLPCSDRNRRCSPTACGIALCWSRNSSRSSRRASRADLSFGSTTPATSAQETPPSAWWR